MAGFFITVKRIMRIGVRRIKMDMCSIEQEEKR